MTDWKAIGGRIGALLGTLVDRVAGDRIRSHYAAKLGTCERCEAVLSGHSPAQLCKPCHVDAVLESATEPSETAEA